MDLLTKKKVGEIFFEGGAKNVLAASARLGAASLTQLIGGDHVTPWEAGTNQARPIDQMIGNLAGPNTGPAVDEPIRGFGGSQSHQRWGHMRGSWLPKHLEVWCDSPNIDLGPRDHKDFMLCQVSHKVDIIFWAGLKPDIWLEEKQMKSSKTVIKVSCNLWYWSQLRSGHCSEGQNTKITPRSRQLDSWLWTRAKLPADYFVTRRMSPLMDNQILTGRQKSQNASVRKYNSADLTVCLRRTCCYNLQWIYLWLCLRAAINVKKKQIFLGDRIRQSACLSL